MIFGRPKAITRYLTRALEAIDAGNSPRPACGRHHPFKNNSTQKYDVNLMPGYNGVQYIAEKYALENPVAVQTSDCKFEETNLLPACFIFTFLFVSAESHRSRLQFSGFHGKLFPVFLRTGGFRWSF